LNVFFRVDLSTHAGLGHIARCVVLAQQFKSVGWSARFVVSPAEKKIWKRYYPAHEFEVLQSDEIRIETENPLEGLWSKKQQEYDAQSFCGAISSFSPAGLIVVDHYGLDRCWERSVKCRARWIITLEDCPNRSHDCDALIDTSPFSSRYWNRYRNRTNSDTFLFLGPQFMLVSPKITALAQFQRNQRDQSKPNILISFGGGDNNNISQKVLEAIENLGGRNAKYVLLVGPNNKNLNKLAKRAARMPFVTLLTGITDMVPHLKRATLAIGGMGVSLWERMFAQIPNIVIAQSIRHDELCREIDARGAIKYLGVARDVGPYDITRHLTTLIADSKEAGRLVSTATNILRPVGLKTEGEELLRVLQTRLMHDSEAKL
jgi:UDP-2,4-diacetamido-2,4,6-trideoxy-beta-L-altropyranose hydrolase